MKVFLLPWLILFVLVGSVFGLSVGFHRNICVVGGEYVIREGHAVSGDLISFFTQVTVEKGAFVNGSILSFSSTLDISGSVTGNISSLESDVKVRKSAEINAIPNNNGILHLVILLPKLARWNDN